jgi:hypothetical protein
MRRDVSRSVLVLAALAAACGGDRNPAAPSRPAAAPASGLPAGTVITVVSGGTAAPLAGVAVSVGGQTVVTDGAGQARLPAAAPVGTPVDLTHPDHLDRQTTIRQATGPRFTLWPRTSADGLTEHYTATLAYTGTADPPPPTGASALQRLPAGTTSVVVVPSPALLEDGRAMEAHAEAVRTITEATGATVSYLLSPSRPPSGIVITTRVDSVDPLCVTGDLRGFMRGTYRGSELTSGEIVFCEDNVARSPTIAHELGHTFGLRHGPEPNDLMFFRFGSRRATVFGPRESVVMRMMLDRPAGNRFPDSDRGVAGAAATEERVVVCR